MKFKQLFFLIFFLFSACAQQPVKNHTPSSEKEDSEEAAIIDLTFYKEKSKKFKPVRYEVVEAVEEIEEEDNEIEIVSLLTMLQSEEERKFFDLGKKAPPPARYFILPVGGSISSKYGPRKKRMHHGIDIPGRPGTHLKAANHGKVVFAGQKKGYGQVVILSHHPDLFTVYAHNSKNLVNYGQIVKKNETIALMGNTGRSTGAHVHFEIRRGTKSIDPLKFLAEQEKKQ